MKEIKKLKIYRINNEVYATRISKEDTLFLYSKYESNEPIIIFEEWKLNDLTSYKGVEMIIKDYLILIFGSLKKVCKYDIPQYIGQIKQEGVEY